MKVFYFGCIDKAGHYLWTKFRVRLFSWTDAEQESLGIPWVAMAGAQPNRWCISENQLLGNHLKSYIQGRVIFQQKDGWTSIAWYDWSVDQRPNCMSAFLIDKLVNVEEALVLAAERFPEVMDRFDYALIYSEADAERKS